MTVTPLTGLDIPDTAIAPLAGSSPPPLSGPASFAGALENAFDSAGGALEKADRSERAFARGTGGLQEMVLDRAQADIALSIATTTASRASAALSTILGMQI
jgi:flagellar hook-basal body complex protein FliE